MAVNLRAAANKIALFMVQAADDGKSIRGHNDRDRARVPVTRMVKPTIPIRMVPVAMMPVSAVIAVGTMIIAPMRLGVLVERQ